MGGTKKSRPDQGRASIEKTLGQAILYQQSGNISEALEIYGQILAAEPDQPIVLNLAGIAAFQSGNHSGGVRMLRRAIALQPDFAEAHSNLGGMLVEQGYKKAALGCFRRAIDIDPLVPDYHSNLGIVLLDLDRPKEALQAFDSCLAVEPGNTHALAFKTNALLILGERDTVDVLVDFDRFIQPLHFQPPPLFADLAAFNNALVEHVLAHPSLMPDRPGRTTRIGAQTGDLLAGAKGPIGFLEGMIRAVLEDYHHDLPDDPTHPFVAAKPSAYRLTAWATVLNTRGYQDPHNHPNAWLSGVYYVKVPDRAVGPDEDPVGWIEFGRPDPRHYPDVEARVKLIRPVEGLALLFPSYFWHRTVPTESSEQRISIAFDVVPKG